MKLTIFVVTTILRLTPATPARTIQMMMMMLSGDVQNASRRGPFSLFVSAVCGVLCLCQYYDLRCRNLKLTVGFVI